MIATRLLGLFSLSSVSQPRSATAEDQLVERLRRGDTAAVGEAYDLHHASLRRFARRLVGEDASAEDLVQEVFVTLPQAVQRFQGDSSLSTFLVAIAVNHTRHHLRSASRRRAAMERFAQETPAEAPDPEHHASRASLARALSCALDTLPLDQRVVFVLCEVEERTARQAAEIVGAPEATVRTRLFHAKRKLREALDKEGIR